LRDWAVTLLVFIAGLIIAAGGTYTAMEKESARSAVRIEIMDKQLSLFDGRINKQMDLFESRIRQRDDQINKRLNIAEVRAAKVVEAALGQTRAVESLTSVVSSLAGSQKDIAVALAGMNERLKNLEERSASFERKLESSLESYIMIK